jgi:hypothetical protein
MTSLLFLPRPSRLVMGTPAYIHLHTYSADINLVLDRFNFHEIARPSMEAALHPTRVLNNGHGVKPGYLRGFQTPGSPRDYAHFFCSGLGRGPEIAGPGRSHISELPRGDLHGFGVLLGINPDSRGECPEMIGL